MAEFTAPPDPATVRCPTCRAEQEWADTCRRCKCDLREAAASYLQSRRACLLHLHADRPRAARLAARRCRDLAASAESHRLLAVAALRCRDWAAATVLALGPTVEE